jgi:2'-5' RNA ligase
MRLFVGTLLGAASQAHLDRLIRPLVLEHRSVLRGVPSRSAHLTYGFCASAPAADLEAMAHAVTAATAGYRPFLVRLGTPQVVPAGSRPRLVCADTVQGGAEIQAVSEAIVSSLRVACPGLEWGGNRTPHVTLARFRKHAKGRDARAVSRALADLETQAFEDWVDCVHLVASELTESGPVYHVRSEIPLA